MRRWLVYILRCSDDSFYIGVTCDLERRLKAHNDGTGARYTRGRLPVEAVWTEFGHDRSSAHRREAALKRMSRLQKERLVQNDREMHKEVVLSSSPV